LAAAGNFPRFFLIAFFNSPCYETPKTAIKQIEQNNRGRKKNGGTKNIFCDEPRKKFCRVFELPLLRNAQNAIKKLDKQINSNKFTGAVTPLDQAPLKWDLLGCNAARARCSEAAPS
jgi:hypothetical protein